VVVVPASPTLQFEEQRTCTVLAIDRQELFLAAISRLLERSRLLATLLTTTRSDIAIERLMDHAVDVVVCEVRSQPQPGSALVSALAARKPPVPVVLLGETGDERRLVDAFKAGAAGVFTKGALTVEFVEGLAAVLAGHRVIADELIQFLIPDANEPIANCATDGTATLSPTELGILLLLGQAHSIASIATERGVSQKTVRNQVGVIYRKLGLKNRVDAVLAAARVGLADRPY